MKCSYELRFIVLKVAFFVFQDISEALLDLWKSVNKLNIDDLVSLKNYQPVEPSNFTEGLVLWLNHLRVHLGASLEDLASWINQLMPNKFHEKGLKLCNQKLLKYLKLLQNPDEANSSVLNAPLSDDLFVNVKGSDNSSDIDDKTCDQVYDKKYQMVVDEMDQYSDEDDDNSLDEDETDGSSWRTFLKPVNIDKLINGVQQKVPKDKFTNGLLYALWRVTKIMNQDLNLLMNWLKLVTPVKLTDQEYSRLLSAVEPMHNHLCEYPEDLPKLDLPIIGDSDNVEKIGKKSTPSKAACSKSGPNFKGSKTSPSGASKSQNKLDSGKSVTLPTKRNAPMKRPSVSQEAHEPIRKTARVLPQPPNKEKNMVHHTPNRTKNIRNSHRMEEPDIILLNNEKLSPQKSIPYNNETQKQINQGKSSTKKFLNASMSPINIPSQNTESNASQYGEIRVLSATAINDQMSNLAQNPNLNVQPIYNQISVQQPRYVAVPMIQTPQGYGKPTFISNGLDMNRQNNTIYANNIIQQIVPNNVIYKQMPEENPSIYSNIHKQGEIIRVIRQDDDNQYIENRPVFHSNQKNLTQSPCKDVESGQLSNKVSELERQLQEIKNQNEKLLALNKKLLDTNCVLVKEKDEIPIQHTPNTKSKEVVANSNKKNRKSAKFIL